MSEHLSLSRLELNEGTFNTRRRVHKTSGKPCYCIDPELAVHAVRLLGIATQKIVDADSDPMENEMVKCCRCTLALSFEDLQYPRGGRFLCALNAMRKLDLMPRPGSATPATVTTSHDLVYFFNLLKDVERVCEAASHTKITDMDHYSFLAEDPNHCINVRVRRAG